MGVEIFDGGIREVFIERARAQWALSGGGVKAVSNNDKGISWSKRFIIISTAKGSHWSTSGYFDIAMPPNGTVIPSASGGSSVTVANGRIIMPPWGALWYIPPVGSSSGSVPANFRVTCYTDGGLTADWIVPDHWVLVATINEDATSPWVKWGTGEVTDYWRSLALVNGWVNYANEFALAEYQKKSGNRVEVRGLVKSGTANHIATLPVGFRPAGTLIFAVQCDPNVVGRMDIGADGGINRVTGSAAWFSICCTFTADQ